MSRFSHIHRKPLPAVQRTQSGYLDNDHETTERTSQPWRPVTLRPLYLCTLSIITIGLIVIIQWLLYISRRDQGILFAKNINDLPLSQSFSYMYLPTIISVLYSFLWTWVDLDIKRLEPYFQLSKSLGASGRQSVLLSYPLEFLVTLPFTAFKRKHWAVLSASTTVILVFWGLTPIQAGIFAVRTVAISENVAGFYSKEYTPLAQQGNLSAIYSQSVYNIAWLNETLPPFMTKDYVLSPYGPSKASTLPVSNETYTSTTNLYSVDISCETPFLWNNSGIVSYNTSRGCSFYPPPYRPMVNNDTSKLFNTMYVGYQNDNGIADYYLSSSCNNTFLHSFFVRWSELPVSAIASGYEGGSIDAANANSTPLFCEPAYYQQEVNATIRLPSRAVLDVRAIGEKLPLPEDMFNTSTFEWTMSSGITQTSTRSEFPATGFPDQKPQLLDLPLDLSYLPRMAPFAIAAFPRPLADYLDPETLRRSYQAAYRLLFVRQLVDVLRESAAWSPTTDGYRSYSLQAVVIVPSFAYAATSILFLVLLLAIGLLFTTPRRTNKLQRDPATIGALMDLVSGDASTATIFASNSHSSSETLHDSLAQTTFLLSQVTVGKEHGLVRLRCINDSESERVTAMVRPNTDSRQLDGRSSNDAGVVNGVRPSEMKVYVGIMFLVIQLAAVLTFLVLFFKARNETGLQLPSNSSLVRQLVEKYIPISLATFIEPFWLVLNRQMSLLQPFEELRQGSAQASRSINVDYSSLPPQLLFLRAFQARHYMLALLCFMVLSANVLAVALSGLMYEGDVQIATTVALHGIKAPKFRSLDGIGLPFNSYQEQNWQGGTTADPFYRKITNLTANTPLPPWTDTTYAYVPLEINNINATATIQLNTRAYKADLHCEPLYTAGEQHYNLAFADDAHAAALEVVLKRDDGGLLNCTNFGSPATSDLTSLRNPQAGRVALELSTMLASNASAEDDLACRQHILAGWIRAEWYLSPRNQTEILPKMRVASINETMLLCKPIISAGPAEIIVDHSGRLQSQVSVNASSSSIEQYFTSRSADLIAQSHQFLVDNGGTWHKDGQPSDFTNYFIRESTNDTTLLDPALPVPSHDRAAKRLSMVYTPLFAILVATNADLLLEDIREGEGSGSISGIAYVPETRILLSNPAFAVTQAILVCYIITTLIFYGRRPWRVLPRIPGNVASIAAYFAASRALQELSSLHQSGSRIETEKAMSSWQWSYGTFVDAEGNRYRGIEREQLVTLLNKKASFNEVSNIKGW